MLLPKRVLLAVSCFVIFGHGPAEAQDSATDRGRRLLQEVVANPSDKAKVDAFVASLVEVPKGSGRYLVEGDILLAREEIDSYLRDYKTPQGIPVRSRELVVHMVGGKMDYLVVPERRKLTYRFDRNSFQSESAFQFTRMNFRKAADDWIGACPDCGISFTETAAPGAFVVRFENVADGPIAQAFFPSSTDRTLRVFPSYFSADLGFDPVGVLRHEIGHILGYRHEHIQNIPGCFAEGSDWKPLTPYTPNSVMHYFCGGAGSFDLSIRVSDRDGHQCLYKTGKPCPGP